MLPAVSVVLVRPWLGFSFCAKRGWELAAMTDDIGLRPLYLLLFATGIGILVLLVLNAWVDTEPTEELSRHIEAAPLR